MPLAEACTRTRLLSRCRAMLWFDRANRQSRERLQRARLCRALAHVSTHVPLWRTRFAASLARDTPMTPMNAMEILTALPVLTKDQARTGFPDELCSTAGRDDWRLSTSSGTMDRISVVHDFAKRDASRAAELRVRHWLTGSGVRARVLEIPPDACNITCGLGPEGPEDPIGFIRHALMHGEHRGVELVRGLRGRIERRLIIPRTTLPPIDPAPWERMKPILDAYLDRISGERPSLVRGLPSYLVWLADRAAERDMRFPGLRAVLPFGGLMSHAMAQRVCRGFGAPFRDVYGTSEFGAIGVSCGSGRGVHLFEDLFVVEVLRGGRPAEPEAVGRIVVTDLTNRAMGLVRYELGDIGRMIEEPCRCGRPGRRLEVSGRLDEALARDGGGAVTTRELQDLFFRDRAVANFRVERRTGGRLQASVMPRGRHTPDLDALRRALGDLFLPATPLSIRSSAFLRPEPSGKYRFVRSRDAAEAIP
jgi:phenylacetate-CoA ligase